MLASTWIEIQKIQFFWNQNFMIINNPSVPRSKNDPNRRWKENVMCASTLRYEILHNVAWLFELAKKAKVRTQNQYFKRCRYFVVFIGNVVIGIFVKYITGLARRYLD